jgi:hypothetical protein
MNPELESVIRRITKLLAIAQDDRANPNEASAAAGQAEKLMRKFQLDSADLLIRSLKAGDDMETQDCRADAITNGTKAKTIPPWAGFLAVAVAKLCDVGAQSVDHDSYGRAVRFFGYKDDVRLAKWIFDYLIQNINKLAFAYRSTDDYIRNGRGVLADYRKGVVQGIITQINQQIAEKKAEMDRTATGRELMIVKQNAITARFGNVFKTKRTSAGARRADSYHNGYTDGRKVDINRRGVENSNPSPTLRIGN